MLTLLFAATAIGTLNLVSVGFGVLFVGIAVDFGLQFAVRFREAKHDTGDLAEALRLTARRAGSAILDRSTGHSGGLSGVRADGFQRRGRAWADRRHRDADCVLLHDDFPACGDHDLPCARRECRSRFLLGPQAPIRCSRAGTARS